MSGGVLTRFLRRWRQAGAVVAVDPKAHAKWQAILRERERRREQQEHDDLLRALDRVSRWS